MSPHYNAGSGGRARQTHHPGTGNRKKKSKERPSSGRATAAPEAQHSDEAQSRISRNIPLNLSQKIVDTFATAFSDLLTTSASGEDTDFFSNLQQVKQHLYKRDFAAAFGSDEYLATYAVRWSASRALAYLTLFDEVLEHVSLDETTPNGHIRKMQVAAIGGGAGAELLGLAGVQYLRSSNNPSTTGAIGTDANESLQICLTSLDRAAWTLIHDSLAQTVVTPPVLSKYASAAAKTANRALVSPAERLEAKCLQLDVLSPDQAAKQQLEEIIRQSSLITLMFTLNELYSASLADAQKLLGDITNWTRSREGTLLLIVDSPGSYSEIGVGPQKKKYPMRWLLDLALLGTTDQSAEGSVPWEKLVDEDSRWFRLPAAGQLTYPIELENMRFQMHLYRRL